MSGACGGGTITATAGSGSISLSGGTLAASASCSFSVNVTAMSIGVKNNTTGNVTSTESGAGSTASATLTVALVVTLPATEVGRGSATLNGTVNPNGLVTNAWFEWGTDPALTAFTSTTLQGVGSGLAAVAVTAALPEPGLPALRPATTYYFRVVASNSAGSTKGSILSFRTRVVAQILVTGNFLSDGILPGLGDGRLQGGATVAPNSNPSAPTATQWPTVGDVPLNKPIGQ